jgi:hypothetical protein
MDIDVGKLRIEQIVLEGGEILRTLVTAQVIKSMKGKSIQVQEQCQQIIEMYKALKQAMKYVGVHE